MHPQWPPLTIGPNCAEGVWWPCYFRSDIWFKDDLWEASSLSFQSSFAKSWRVFHDRALLGRCFRGFVLPVLKYCSAVWCSAADTHLKLLDRAVSGARFLTGGVFEWDISHRRSVAVLVCFIRSGVTQCTLLMVLSLDRMCQRELHAVLWWRIGTLMHRLAAEPCSTAGLLFPFRCPSWTILLTPFSMVGDWRVSRAGLMLLYWPKLLYPDRKSVV